MPLNITEEPLHIYYKDGGVYHELNVQSATISDGNGNEWNFADSGRVAEKVEDKKLKGIVRKALLETLDEAGFIYNADQAVYVETINC